MLPLSLALSLRPSPLPGTIYTKLLVLHKWVSRTIVATGSIHGLSYLIYFIQKNEVYKVFHLDNFLGVIILSGVSTMFITSLSFFRQRWYSLFYTIHYPLAWMVIVLGVFHARPAVSFLAFWCVFILLSQVFYRIFVSSTVQLNGQYVSRTMRIITLPRTVLPDYFDICSHVRIGKVLWNPLTWIRPTHPYTVASLPSDEDVKLLVRNSRFQLLDGMTCSVMGPFASLDSQVINTKQAILFAGGSGLSFAAPLLRGLELRGAQVFLMWIIRDKGDLQALEKLDVDPKFNVVIYITGENNEYTDTINSGEKDEDLEFQELLDKNSSFDIRSGRPDFNEMTKEFGLNYNDAYAVACGPRQLVNDVQLWAESRNISFAGEKYAI